MKLLEINPLIPLKNYALAARLGSAIEQDQLCLNYFPLIDIASGRTIEVEALLRWPTGEDNYIPPLEFIPVAESHGLMPRLSRWVISSALCCLSKWHLAGIELGMSINLSPTEVKDEALAGFIEEQLYINNVTPSLLGLEIADNTYTKLTTAEKDALNRLRELGVRLILDNVSVERRDDVFQSSQKWQMIKIDWHQAMQMTNDAGMRREIIRFIAHAQKHNIKVVVPGVHTYQEWECISNKKQHLAQGFYFTHPQSAEELDIWFRLSKWQPHVVNQLHMGSAV